MQTIEKACQAKRRLFDYTGAYKKNMNTKLDPKDRELYKVE